MILLVDWAGAGWSRMALLARRGHVEMAGIVSICLFSWWQKGFQQEQGQHTNKRNKTQKHFSIFCSIMFANVPLAQASHMARPRSKRWTKKLYLLTGEAVKYCGHFLPIPPPPNGVFGTDFCEAEHDLPAARWQSQRCTLSSLTRGTKHSWKEANAHHWVIQLPWKWLLENRR